MSSTRNRWMITAAFVLLSLAVAWPTALAEGLSPEHVARLRSVTSAVVSPDGRSVAYTLQVQRRVGVDKDGPAWQELHVADSRSGETRPFITGEVNVTSVAWTPDGGYISFLAKREGDKDTAVYVIPVNGGEARRAVRVKSSILSYSWSPDGKRVAVVAEPPDPKAKEEYREKGFSQEVYEEDWKPRQVFILEALEDEQELQPLPTEGSVFDVQWNPREGLLALAVAPTPLVDDSYMNKRIQVVDSSSGQLLSRIPNPGKLGEIAWSPNGDTLAMISAADIHDPAEGRLMVGPAGGGNPVDLLPGLEGHVSHLAWIGDELVYINDQGVWTHVERIHKDGSNRRVLLSGESRPAISGLSASVNGETLALVASSPQHPPELFILDGQAGTLRRMTNSNPWLADVELAAQEVVRFQARDGLELEGVLIRPLREEAGRRYPLILSVHGGPEAHHSNGWLTSYSNLGQLAAARGMAVFFTNYRGSTGRGVAFSKLSQTDPAGQEFDDLVDAVDHWIAAGLADKEKVGVTGGSYGGYATAWCSTRYSDRFAAGVMFVGISDKISKVGTTDIPNEEFLVHARKRPWDNWQMFLERSPVYYSEQGQTPLLILHGKDDPRVNVGQSRELYRHLKVHGKTPVRLVLYPGEGHGNRRAASRLDYSLRALRWFEHYLKGPGGDPPDSEIDYGPVLESLQKPE